MKWHVGLKDLTEFYNYPHDSTIKKHFTLDDFPTDVKIKHGIYDLKKYNDWHTEHFYGTEEEKTSMAAEKLRYQKARADREEITANELKKTVLPIAKIKQDLSFVFTGIKSRLLSWYKTLPPHLAGRNEKEMGQVLRKEVTEILTDFAQGIQSIMPKKGKKKGKRKE